MKIRIVDRLPCEAHDVLFAAAGEPTPLRSPDFTTWVVFYGPEGGEGHGGA
jgi:hypothetical protein